MKKILGHARVLNGKTEEQNLFMANRMKQIMKKIDFREDDMVKAYDIAFLNRPEFAKKKNKILQSFSLVTPQSVRKTSR